MSDPFDSVVGALSEWQAPKRTSPTAGKLMPGTRLHKALLLLAEHGHLTREELRAELGMEPMHFIRRVCYWKARGLLKEVLMLTEEAQDGLDAIEERNPITSMVACLKSRPEAINDPIQGDSKPSETRR